MEDRTKRLHTLLADAAEYAELRSASRLETCLNEVEELLSSTDEPLESERASLIRHRAIAHFLRDEFEQGIKKAEQALAEYTRLGDQLNAGKSIMIIGNCLNHAGRYSESIEYHLRGSEILAETGDTTNYTWSLINVAVSDLPHPQDDHAQRLANAALDLQKRLKDLQVTMPEKLGDTSWVNNVGDLSIRIGLHCGPVVAGVIGRHRAQYDVWGDTVNTASRMESSGQPDRIHISEDFAMKLGKGASPEFEGTDVVIRQAPYQMRLRGTTAIKGKGEMKTFWLEGA